MSRRPRPTRSAIALACMLAAAAGLGGCGSRDGHRPASAPGDGGSAGAAPVGSTAYPVPAGALFVAPAGDDHAAGSQHEPLRTLGAAVAKAPVAGTIVLRGAATMRASRFPRGGG
jgi:hypothetical protein